MRLKRIFTSMMVVIMMLSLSTLSIEAKAAAADTLKYTTVKLEYGAEFSVPTGWEKVTSDNQTVFNRVSTGTNDTIEVASISIWTSKQDKGTYKDLAAFINSMEKGPVGFVSKKDEVLKSAKIKAAYAQGTVLHTVYNAILDFGGWGCLGRRERVYFKTTKGDYYAIQFITSAVSAKTGECELSNVIPKLIATFKEIKPFTVKPVVTPRLFPISNDGIFSYVDITGKEILKTPYGFADDFVGGYAHIMNEFGGMSGYIDTKGNQLDSTDARIFNNKANIEYEGAREIKGTTIVDLSKKTKKYDKQDPNVANEIDHITEYSVGDGFMISKWQASGAANVRLFKNGKQLLKDNKQLSGNQVFLIVKYDDEKIIRFLYMDSSTGKMKTVCINYDGKVLFTKPTPVIKDKSQAKKASNNNEKIFEGIDLTGINIVYNSSTTNNILATIDYTIKGDLEKTVDNVNKVIDAVVFEKIGEHTLTDTYFQSQMRPVMTKTALADSGTFPLGGIPTKLLVFVYSNITGDPNQADMTVEIRVPQ